RTLMGTFYFSMLILECCSLNLAVIPSGAKRSRGIPRSIPEKQFVGRPFWPPLHPHRKAAKIAALQKLQRCKETPRDSSAALGMTRTRRNDSKVELSGYSGSTFFTSRVTPSCANSLPG